MNPRPCIGVAREDVRRPAVDSAFAVLPGPDERAVPVERDAEPEAVSSAAVVGGELGLQGPHPAGPGEQVGRPGPGRAAIGLERADERAVAVERDGVPEEGTQRSVVGDELGLPRPRRPVPDEDVGGPAVGPADRADERAVAIERRGAPEGARVEVSVELGFLDPRRAVPGEDVRRPAGRGAVVIARGSDEGPVAVERDRHAEVVEPSGVVGRELGLLGPRPRVGVADEHVRGPAVVSALVLLIRPDERAVPVERDRETEGVASARVGRFELCFLAPGARPDVTSEHVRGPSAVGARRSDEGPVAVERDRDPEVVSRAAVFSDELSLPRQGRERLRDGVRQRPGVGVGRAGAESRVEDARGLRFRRRDARDLRGRGRRETDGEKNEAKRHHG